MRKPETLQDLFDLMVANDPQTLDVHGQWRSDLPTFGGTDPRRARSSSPEYWSMCTPIWSWNGTHAIVGICADDLTIEEYGS